MQDKAGKMNEELHEFDEAIHGFYCLRFLLLRRAPCAPRGRDLQPAGLLPKAMHVIACEVTACFEWEGSSGVPISLRMDQTEQFFLQLHFFFSL